MENSKLSDYKICRQNLASNEGELYDKLIEAEKLDNELAFLNAHRDNKYVEDLRTAFLATFVQSK